MRHRTRPLGVCKSRNDAGVRQASNDAVVGSLGRSVGGHAPVGVNENENGSDSEPSEWSTSGERWRHG